MNTFPTYIFVQMRVYVRIFFILHIADIVTQGCPMNKATKLSSSLILSCPYQKILRSYLLGPILVMGGILVLYSWSLLSKILLSLYYCHWFCSHYHRSPSHHFTWNTTLDRIFKLVWNSPENSNCAGNIWFGMAFTRTFYPPIDFRDVWRGFKGI